MGGITDKADTEPAASGPRKTSFWRRVLFWLGVAALAVVVMPIVLLIAVIPQNLSVRDQMKDFCGTFHAGQPATQDEIVRRARELDFKTSTLMIGPPEGKGKPFPTVLAKKVSWSGTTWRCMVLLEDGKVSAAEFRGHGMAD